MFSYGFGAFLALRSAQDRLQTDPRRIQERSKSDAFFVLIFDSFWDRLGVVLGVVLGAKIDLKSFLEFNLNRLVFDLAIGWSQDGRQDRPKRAQEPPRAAQDPPKTLPRGPKTSQEPPKTVQRGPKSPQEWLKKP